MTQDGVGTIPEPLAVKEFSTEVCQTGVLAWGLRARTKLTGRVERGGFSAQARAALDRLRTVLKFTTAAERRAAITALPQRVSQALLAFMEAPQREAEALPSRKRRAELNCDDGQCKTARGTDVRVIHNIRGTTYKVQLRLQHLRMYTCAQTSIEAAARHRMIFARFRDVIESVGESVWDDPTRFCLLFQDTLKQHGTSEQEMGLGVFIYMRADQWIDRSRVITSPTLALADAVVVHSRLLRAQKMSWEALRAEWVPLLRRTQKSQAKMLSQAEAEEMAEQSHRNHVKKRLQVAVPRVARALARWGKAISSEARAKGREGHRVSVREAVREAACRQLASKQHRRLRDKQWRWLRRADLSIAEMMRGPPLHIQSA